MARSWRLRGDFRLAIHIAPCWRYTYTFHESPQEHLLSLTDFLVCISLGSKMLPLQELVRAACEHPRSNKDIIVALSNAVAVLAASPEGAQRLARALASALRARNITQLEDNCLLDLATDALCIPGVQQVSQCKTCIQRRNAKQAKFTQNNTCLI